MRANALLAMPLPRLEIIRDASLEVRGPVIYATLVVIAVFLHMMHSFFAGSYKAPREITWMSGVVMLHLCWLP
jgi:multidrug efflux pump subunit AcrB